MKSAAPTLEQQIIDAQQRLDGLCGGCSLREADPSQLLPQALQELSNALEELRVSADELQTHNEELLRTRDAVERERRRYLELFELAPDAYLVTDELGTIVEANHAAATLFHRRQYFLVGKPLSVFVARAGHLELYEALNGIRRGAVDRIEDQEIHLLLHDGAEADISVTAAAVRDPSSQISSIRWLLHDITERKHAETLRAEHAQLAAFGSAVGRALTESALLREALQGCAEAMVEHLGATLARIWTMTEAEQVLELQASAGLYTHIDGGHGRIPLGELKIGLIALERRPHLTNDISHDPRIHDQAWVQREGLVAFAGYPLIIEHTMVGVMALFARQALGTETLAALGTVAREIALGVEHRRTEQRLAGALQQIEHIMETVPDVMYTLDAEACLIRWNRELETATGLAPQELRGRPATTFFPDVEQEAVTAAVQQACTTGYWGGEADLLRQDGSSLPYYWSMAPLKDDVGRVIGLTGVGRDLSDRKRAEHALSQLSGRLIRLQDEERRRIGRELHDSTAQNLAGVAMNLSVINQSRARLNQHGCRALDESTELVNQCVREIRTIAYLLHPPFLDEVGLASAVRWYVDGFAQRSGIRTDLTISPEIERLPQEVETALFRVVQECLSNVHRHSGSPSVGIHISRGVRIITLEVSDEGRGLPAGASFSAAAVAAASGAPLLGVGIMGMRERMKQLGGQLDVIRRTRGTTVRATVPVKGEEP